MITKDGRTVWTNVTGSLVRAADGSPDYLLAVIERIDQRKELELRLVQREREATQQAAEVLATLDAIPHPVVVVDIHGQITRSNAVARDYMRHLGIKPEVRFLNDRMNDLLSITAADGRPLKLHDRPLWRVLAGEVLASANAVELVLRKRGGTELRMSVTGAPVRNDAGEIVEGVCVFRDITGEWLLERELAERASQLETAFEAMTDAVLVMDAEGNLVRANAAYRRLFASLDPSAEPPRELLARISRLALRNSLGRIIPREETPSMRVLTGEVLSGLNAVELGVIDENERETLLIATGAPLHDLNGMITGGVCIYRDVSERRSDAAQSRDLFRDLLSIAVLVASSAGDADGRSQLVARLPLLVSDICDITRRKLGCLHVGLIAVDPLSGALSPVGASGMSPEYEREWRDEAERSSLPDYFGAAMRMRLHQGEVVVHDVRVTSPEQVHRRILAAPVRADGTLIGILGCEQVGSVREYTAGELELVTAAANVAALALLAERSRPHRSSIVGDGLFTSHSDVAQLLSTLVTTFEQPIATLRRESIRSADDSLGRKRARHVESALRSLEGELGVLREFAEIQGGTFRLRRGRVDLGALLWREVERQRRRHTLRQIVFDGPRSGMVIEGDARRLRWIFEVLLNGAISATPADMPVEVTLTADSLICLRERARRRGAADTRRPRADRDPPLSTDLGIAGDAAGAWRRAGALPEARGGARRPVGGRVA